MCNFGEEIAREAEVRGVMAERKRIVVSLFDLNIPLIQIASVALVPVETIVQWLKDAGRNPV